MRYGWTVPMVAMSVFAGCAAHDKSAVKAAAPLSEAAKVDASSLLLPRWAPLEPLGCPLYAGDDRPDYDADSLKCLVQWLRETQDYLAKGGRPTKYTNAEAFDRNREYARKLQARLARFVERARYEAVASAPRPALPAAAPPDAHASSSQAYLEGMIDFQKGDYVRARKDWERALTLDPTSDDAKAGLAKLDQLEKGN